jgi:hypothetical protein
MRGQTQCRERGEVRDGVNKKLWLLAGIMLLLLSVLGCRQGETMRPTPTATAELSPFKGDGFSFLYPSDWRRMTEVNINELWKSELRGQISGFSRQNVIWNGGVFTGYIDPSNHPDSANIFVLKAKVAGLPGPMSEADFDRVLANIKASFERGLGERLLFIQKRKVGEFQAIELEGLGKSRRQILRSVFIFARADHMYFVNCGASKDSYDSFAPVFEQAIASLKVSPE